MNIFLFEMRRQRSAIIGWAAALSFVCLFFLALYPSFASGLQDVLKNYPPQLLDALNMNPDKLSTFFGYYTFALTYTALVGAIGAVYFGMGMLSRENREKTADFFHSKPVTRSKAVTAKLLAVLCSLVIINIIYVVTSIFWGMLVAKTGDGFDVGIMVQMSSTLFVIQLVFAAFGVFIATFFRRVKAVLPVSLAVGFGFFLLSAFDAIINDAVRNVTGNSSADVMQYLSPTKYFDYQALAGGKGFAVTPFVTAAVVLVIFVGASVIWYRRQDIHAI